MAIDHYHPKPLKYKEYIASPPLAPYIKCFWTLDAAKTWDVAPRNKIVPDGCIELIINYGDRFQRYLDDNTVALQSTNFVHGQLTRYIEIGPSGDTGILGVRFRPFGFAAFTNIPVAHITENTAELQDIWKDGKEIADRVIAANTNTERVHILSAFLLEKLNNHTFSKSAMITHAVKTIVGNGGDLKVSALTKELYTTERSLERMFLSSVGLRAKTFARISRFQNALQAVHRTRETSLTALAHTLGYYDQAHFIRDVRHFTGESPSQYFSGNNELMNLFAGL